MRGGLLNFAAWIFTVWITFHNPLLEVLVGETMPEGNIDPKFATSEYHYPTCEPPNEVECRFSKGLGEKADPPYKKPMLHMHLVLGAESYDSCKPKTFSVVKR